MKVRAIAATALVLLWSGCSSRSAEPPAPSSTMVEHEVVIQEGQSAVLTSHLSVAFESVAEDSRCPTNVVCVWEGNARVAIRLLEPAGTADTSLNTNAGVGPRFLQRGAVRIELVDLEPQPQHPAGPAQVRRIRLRWGFLPD